MNVAMPQGVMEMAEKQQFNVFDNLVYSDKPKGQPVDIEMIQDVDKHLHAEFQFIVTQDPLTIQIFEKVVRQHRLHKYAGKDLLLKRQMRAQEGAKKGR